MLHLHQQLSTAVWQRLSAFVCGLNLCVAFLLVLRYYQFLFGLFGKCILCCVLLLPRWYAHFIYSFINHTEFCHMTRNLKCWNINMVLLIPIKICQSLVMNRAWWHPLWLSVLYTCIADVCFYITHYMDCFICLGWHQGGAWDSCNWRCRFSLFLPHTYTHTNLFIG